MKNLKRFWVFFVGLLLICEPWAVSAQTFQITQADTDAGFNPQKILDDRDVFEIQNFGPKQIQEFLSSKTGVLATYRTLDMDGVEKSATDIIWRVAASYKINPKYLLALMQKEQSLVEDPNPKSSQYDWATGFAVCDGCSVGDPSVAQFKGFATQIEWAAKQHREKYLLQILGKGQTIAGYAPGKPITIDGNALTPENQATAMLYSYTPHLRGNLNLWRIWQRWFSLAFPDGSVVRGKTSKTAFLIRFGEKRPFKNISVAASLVDTGKILQVEDSQLAAYPTGKPISFPNYSLIQLQNKKRYLVAGDTKRLIVNRQVFAKLGFNEDEVIEAKATELEPYKNGPDITLASAYPAGLLAKDADGYYWYIEEGVRRLIPHKTLLSLYFRGRPAKLLPQKILSKFEIGNPYRLQDGELVRAKEDPSVFVIEHGRKRPIPSASIFEEMGWQWKNVVVLPQELLKTYDAGEPLNPRPSAAGALVKNIQAESPS